MVWQFRRAENALSERLRMKGQRGGGRTLESVRNRERC